MPIYARYDTDGTIVGITEHPELPEVPGLQLFFDDGPFESVELELDDETAGLDHGKIIQQYRIDPATRTLVKL